MLNLLGLVCEHSVSTTVANGALFNKYDDSFPKALNGVGGGGGVKELCYKHKGVKGNTVLHSLAGVSRTSRVSSHRFFR